MTDQAGANLAYVGHIVFQAEPGKGIEFLAVKLDGAAGKIAGTAGMQVNAYPLSQIVSLVDFQVGRFGEKKIRFHSVVTRVSEWRQGMGIGVGNFSIFLQMGALSRFFTAASADSGWETSIINLR